jgi:hypothetical protein
LKYAPCPRGARWQSALADRLRVSGGPGQQRAHDTRVHLLRAPVADAALAHRQAFQMARVVLSVLVTPGEVSENRPMLDLLWRTCSRWKLRPHHVTGDGKYGTIENIRAVEEAGIRAYIGLHEAGGRGGFFPKSVFAYDTEEDIYLCPAGETLRALDDAEGNRKWGRIVTYRAKGSVCAACDLKPQCTTNKNGRSLRRGPGDEHIDLIRAYMETEPYLKAIRKRKVWIEPLFAEDKLWHGMRRFRTRTLEKTNAEALLIAAGQNVKRLLAFGGRWPKKPAQAAALRPPARPLRDPAHRRRGAIAEDDARIFRFSTRWLDNGTESLCPIITSRNLVGVSPKPIPIAKSRFVLVVGFLGQ